MTERFDPFQIFINCREYKLVVLFIQKMVYRYKVIQEPHISHIQLKERTYTVHIYTGTYLLGGQGGRSPSLIRADQHFQGKNILIYDKRVSVKIGKTLNYAFSSKF